MKKFLCKLFGHRYLMIFSHLKNYKSHNNDAAKAITVYRCLRCDHLHTFVHSQLV
jgi:hypothetical protein